MAKATFNEFKSRLHWSGEDGTCRHYETHSTHSHFEIDGRMIPMGLCMHDQATGIVYFADPDGSLLAESSYFHVRDDEEHEYKLFTCVEVR